MMNIAPPSSLEAEQAILGSMLIDRDVLLKLESILSPDDFYDQGNRLIYEVMLDLSRRGIPIDIVTLSNELKGRDLVEKVGGIDYIIQLASNVPTTANFEYYSNIIKDKSIRRKLIKVGNTILGFDFNSQKSAEELLDKAESLIFDLSESNRPLNFYHVRELLPDCFERIEAE